jgi:hypothetical protein
VLFGESSFPFAEIFDPPSSSFDFLSELNCTPLPIGTNPPAGPSGTVVPNGPTPQAVASGAWVFSTPAPPPGIDAHDQLIEFVMSGLLLHGPVLPLHAPCCAWVHHWPRHRLQSVRLH